MKKALAMILLAGCATTPASEGNDGSGAGGKADDDGSTSGSITAWSTRPTKISPDHAVALRPSFDESRIAYSEDAADYSAWGCWGRAGIGDLRIADANTPSAPIHVSSLAGFRESAWTADSSQLVYTQYTAGINPCSDFVGVAAVPAAGGTASSLHSFEYYYKQLSVAGSTVVFAGFGGGANDPGTLYQVGTNAHAYGYLGTGAGKYVASQDPTGKALVYDAADGHIRLRQLGATTDIDLSATYTAAGEPVWTPDGATLAISSAQNTTRVVTLMARDGSSPRTALTGCTRQAQISPDGTWIACETANALLVAPVAGGAQFSLTGLPDAQPSEQGWWSFTPDSAFIHYTDPGAGAGFLEYGLFTAPVASGSVFTKVTDQLYLNETATAAHDYLAYLALDANYNHSAVVVKPNGDHVTVVANAGDAVRYEPTGARKLAVIANGQASLYATDGSGTPIVLPGAAVALPAPFWKDDVLFYAVNKRKVNNEDAYDLIAASEDGSRVGVVLSGVTNVVTNHRVFLTRAQGVGGGVYVFDN